MRHRSETNRTIGGLAAALLGTLLAGVAAGQSMFDRQPYGRDFIEGQPISVSLMVGTIATDAPEQMFAEGRSVGAEAEPHWRAEFNPLNLERVGGRGFVQPALPRVVEPRNPAPAAIAAIGLGIAAVVGGRRRRRPRFGRAAV